MATLFVNGQPIEIAVGQTLLEAIQQVRASRQAVACSCPGVGQCKECLVRVTAHSEALTPLTSNEAFLAHHSDSESAVHRLACQARLVRDDVSVEIESFKRRLEIVQTGKTVPTAGDPWMELIDGQVYCDGDKLAEHDGALLGLAIDIGTTTVVMHVVDLPSGETLYVRAFENPQKYGGSDILHRISYDGHHPGQLHRTIIAYLNDTLDDLPIATRDIWAVTIAANPTMRDLLFGLDVQTIGQSPFISRTEADVLAGRSDTTSLWADARQLGLHTHRRARVYGLPLIGHHVGADMAAVLATIPIDTHDGPFLVIDIGTNTELVVGDGDRLLAASCAAGPAFEGGRIACGMPAGRGAITELARCNGEWQYAVIGDGPARGLCGSGLVDLLAELRRTDAMDELGRFEGRASRATVCDDPPVFLTRSDASELAQTKGAIGLGQMILLKQLGIEASQLQACYLAGAFASQMDLDKARQIGLFPAVPDESVVRIGNASVEGAKSVLCSRTARDQLEMLVRRVEHVELEKEPNFFDLFAEMTLFQPIPD